MVLQVLLGQDTGSGTAGCVGQSRGRAGAGVGSSSSCFSAQRVHWEGAEVSLIPTFGLRSRRSKTEWRFSPCWRRVTCGPGHKHHRGQCGFHWESAR